MLDQILGELERTPIRNAEDRKRMLQMIDGYGDHFYNTDIFSTEPNIKNQLRKEIRAAIDRQPSELEFLSEAELAEAREAYRRFQERKNGPDPDAPTVNGPRTEVEHAFLNVERLGLLYTMQGRLSADRTFSRDPLHSETLAQLDSFLTQVENFYANADYLKPEQQAARDAAFAKIVQDSAALSTQIGKSIDQLTNNGRKERFNQAESKQLESLKTMQDQVRHMRSLHAAQIDFEIRKREDLARFQQEEQRKLEERRQLREDVARLRVVDNEDGTFYVDRDFLVSQLSDEAVGYLSEAYPNGLPDMFLAQNFDGHLLPEEVHRRMSEDLARREAEAREAEQKRRQAVIDERAKRREEITAEDLTGAAVDLFATEDRRLEEERRAGAEPEKRALRKELRAIAREEEKAREEHRQRLEAIAADESYDWEMRRMRIEAEEERFNEQRAAEGTGWESRRARIEERLRQIDEAIADRQFNATRRQQEALDTGDERYTWSFRRILQDVCDRKDAAEQAFTEAKNNPDNTVHDITQKGIRAYEESERYKQMMNLVGASFETEKLRAALEKKWPDWVAQQLMPNLEGTTDPKLRHSRMILAMRTTLPAAEVHAFLDEQIATLREDLKDDLRRRLLTVQNKTELAFEDQVAHPLHERVEELKRQVLFDSEGHLLDRKGAPYPPDSVRDGLLVDERGVPYPPDSEEQKGYQHQKALADALAYADQVITVADSTVRSAYQKHHDIHEKAYEAQRKRDSDGIIAGMERYYRNMLNALLTDGQAFVANGVHPWEVDDRDYIVNSGYQITPEHNDKITQLLTYMEEMQLPVSDDVPGGTGEDRAFSNLTAAQDALTQAVQDGDAEKIFAAKQNLEQARKDIEKLYAYVKNEANFPAESVPGNVDATRSAAIPLEYSKDTFASSKLNGIHTLYSALKWAGISIQEFHNDPNTAIRTLYEKSMEPLDPEIQLGEKSLGEILGGFAAETNEDRTKRIAQTNTIQEVVRRSVEAIVTMGKDEEARKQNLLTATLHEQYNANVLDHRLKHTNPFMDPKRKTEVQQLLSIVEEENLEADLPKMVMSKPLDARGYAVETITAENYVDSLGPDFDKYLNLVTRGEEMLTDAARTGGAGFDPVEFMENRQKALSMMLVRRVADRNKAGFNLLEDEVVNTAENYESIRLAHPELPLPALTAEQKKLFDTRGKQFRQQLKRAENALSREQKQQIADRGAELRTLLAGMRKAGDHRGRVDAELEKRNLHLWDPPKAVQAAPAGDRISNEDAAARLSRQQDAARQRQEAREQEQRNRLLAEQAKNAREERLRENLALPLAKRLDDVFRGHFWSQYTRNEMLKQGLDKSQPESFYDATLNADDAQRRMNDILKAATEGLTKESFANILTETLGAEKAGELLTKLGGNVPQIYAFQRLTAEDRMVVFAALAGNLPAERQKEILQADDDFLTVRAMETTTPVTFDSTGPEKTVFERQVDHPANDRVNDILKQAGLDWAGMTDGKGTQAELDAFRRDLADANALFTRVKPEIQARAVDRMGADFRLFNAREALILAEGKKKPQNAYLLDLFVTEKGVTVSKESRQRDIRETSRTNPAFDPKYVAGMAKLMRKMEEFGVLKTGLNAEEGGKVYAFHQVYEARHQLDLALQADMTVEENRKKLSQAVREMKEAQSRTDELMRMAKGVFSKSDYMDNLDSTRATGVPWQYARDIVTSSQLSGVYMFANYLKENNISVEEFERHPDQVIEKLKTRAQEGATRLSNITKGRSMGEILVCGATNYFDGMLQYERSRKMGKYTRGIDALIEGDPGDDEPRKEQNRFIYRQNVMNYMENIANGARNNATLLKDGFLGKSREGFEAIKIMAVIPEEDFDPDTMITKVPMNTDGSRRQPFHLGNYLMDKGDINYQAQVGRLETMIADAKRAEAQFIREEREQDLMDGVIRYPGVVGGAFRRDRFQVPMLLQARQQALIEMLAIHPENSKEPGFAQLEDEVLHMPERYEALRKAQPELNLPALSKVWKKALESQKKNYLDLKNNRTKLMNKAEETIRKGVKAEEKRFNSQMKQTAERIRKLNERIARRDAKIEQANATIHQAALRDNEKKGLAAYEEKVALIREKRELEEERQKLEQSLNSLRVDRMKTLTTQYREGKLPYTYVRARLQQIDEGREQEALPEIFGNYKNNEEDKEIRDRFLGDRILNDYGADVNMKPAVIDHPMNWMVWNNRFWTEAEAAEQSQAAQDLDLMEGAYEEEFVFDEPLESEQTEPTRDMQEQKPPVQPAEPPKQEQKPPVQPAEPPRQEQKPPVQPVEPPKQEQKPPVQQAEPPKQEQKPQPQRQQREQDQQLIEELKKYPPKRREPGVHAPVRNPLTGEILIRSHDINVEIGDLDAGDETLPRAILNCGDIAVLRQYKKMYADTLKKMPDGQMYIEYLDQRIAGLNRIDQAVKTSGQRTEKGRGPVSPAVTTFLDGTVMLANFRQTDFQTSVQGCWSVALSNLLKSRGVDLTQKDVRAFRATKTLEQGDNAKALETNEFNNEAGSDPFHDSELVMKTVPNTAMHTWGFENLPPARIENGAVYRDEADDTAVEAIREQVKYALEHDHSPVAIKCCGHYRTIVGIKGNTLLLKDSRQPNPNDLKPGEVADPDYTHSVDLYKVVRETRMQPAGYQRDLSLVWLSELHRDKVTGGVEELKNYPDLRLDDKGKITLSQAENAEMLTLVGPTDTECAITSQQGKLGLVPYYWTKFPNEIKKNLLKNAKEPSRSIDEHLTLPDAEPSPERGQIVERLLMAPSQGTEPTYDASLMNEFWQREENRELFKLMADVCYDAKGNIDPFVQEMADEVYQVHDTATGLTFAQNLIMAIQSVPETQRSEAQNTALALAMDRAEAWKPVNKGQQVWELSAGDLEKKFGTPTGKKQDFSKKRLEIEQSQPGFKLGTVNGQPVAGDGKKNDLRK
ncbi:MAG: hypothetical protein K6G16_00080 [Lachnospiraceae bacterium]|nr:hypothetical protein [Lachnospiraceae bacterium]